jgi:RNA polymerase sigma-70 factor, ECF subfamily
VTLTLTWQWVMAARPYAEVRSTADVDTDLLSRLRRRERPAFAELVALYGPALTRVAYCHLSDSHAAEDAVQDTFVGAWAGAARTTTATSLRSWLFAILFNICRKRIRTRTRVRLQQPADFVTPAAATTDDDRILELRAALAQLQDDHREVVVLRFLEKLDVSETASALEIPEGTVKSRTHAAIGHLRTLMGEEP